METKRAAPPHAPPTAAGGWNNDATFLAQILDRRSEMPGGGIDPETLAQLLAERARALAALRESEARFRSAFEHAAIGMALVSLDGRWLQVNRSLCDIVGYSEPELLAIDLRAITHAADADADLGLARRLIAGEIDDYRIVKRCLHKSSRTVWALLSISAVRDDAGQAMYFVAQIQDITSGRVAEETLRGSEQRFRSLASHAPVGIFQRDTQGNNIFVNKRWRVMTGLSAQEAAGLGWTAAIHPEDRERIVREWRLAAPEGREFSLEYRYRDRAGKTTWVHGTATPIPNDDGDVVGYIGTSTDLTERKQAEWLERDRREVLELVAENRSLGDVLDRLAHLIERQTAERAAVLLLDSGEISLHVASLPSSAIMRSWN